MGSFQHWGINLGYTNARIIDGFCSFFSSNLPILRESYINPATKSNIKEILKWGTVIIKSISKSFVNMYLYLLSLFHSLSPCLRRITVFSFNMLLFRGCSSLIDRCTQIWITTTVPIIYRAVLGHFEVKSITNMITGTGRMAI